MNNKIKVYKFINYTDAEPWLNNNKGIAIGREHQTREDSFTHVLISNILDKQKLGLINEFIIFSKQVPSRAGHRNYLYAGSQDSLMQFLLNYSAVFQIVN
jgi:hypothetical protein